VNWTILEIIKWTTDFFKSKNIDNSRLDAELILSHYLKIPRLQLYLNYDQPLLPEERENIKKAVIRRANLEPLQYILEETEFYNTTLKTDRRALIPRHETELLVEEIVKNNKPRNILDIGTGSGAIAISLAKRLPEARVTACDISDEALELARENAQKNGVSVDLVNSDIFDKIIGRFDVIVSNPPYISKKEYAELQPEIRRFEPVIALVAEENGIYFYRKILEKAADYLTCEGKIYFEIGSKQAESITEIAKKNGYTNIIVKKDYNDFDRIVILRK